MPKVTRTRREIGERHFTTWLEQHGLSLEAIREIVRVERLVNGNAWRLPGVEEFRRQSPPNREGYPDDLGYWHPETPDRMTYLPYPEPLSDYLAWLEYRKQNW